jgi:anti-sigma regulatory factor (Ser/Thr protein kinase)
MSEATGASDLTDHASDETHAGRGPLVIELTLSSEAGNERVAMERVAAAVASVGLTEDQLDRLKTAVAETTLNAIEHGNRYNPDLEVKIEVYVSPGAVAVRVTDQGSGPPAGSRVAPDLDAKLAGEQSPRGWGLFLIEHMVDEMRVSGDSSHHTVELTIRRDTAE